jgi:hypothetical protein
MEIKRVSVNGININLYNEKEEEVFKGIYKQIKHLEEYITSFSVWLSLGQDMAVVEFNNQFRVEFDTDNYTTKKIETTFSNQKINKSFIELAKKLYELN